MDVNLLNAVLVIIGLLPISIGCMLLVRKNVSLSTLKTHHDVTDPLLAVLGTLFTILLGFMLANSMQRFEGARDNAQQEAAAVGDVYRLMGGFPDQTRDKGRKDCLAYMDAVIDDEWKKMQNGKLSDAAWNAYGDIWQDCLHIEPKTQGESDIHQTILASMTKLGECRRSRAAEMVYSLPRTLWFIVIFCGISTICFTYFFAIEDLRLQILMTSVITIIIGLNIYMLVGYDAPFSGDIAVTSDSFETARESLRRVQSHEIH